MDILKMSDLQLSLIVIGVIIIIGVIVFNWIQQMRYRRKVQAAFDHKHDDVLLSMPNNKDSDQRIEPLLNKNFSVDLPVDLQRSGELKLSTDNKKSLLASVSDYDDTTNYVVYIRSDSIIANIHIAKLLQRKFDFGKSVVWLGQKQKTEPWEEITIETNVDIDGYTCLKGCLQLADRAGSVSEVNLSKFRDLVHDFASQINGIAECPDIVSTHEKAVLLDRFCADVDVMIGINIISK
ncbi:MAG: cell division protein FtsZ, partial [Pseudomonadota bacterium]